MESIIPFTKDLDFKTPVSEITSISLEREYNVLDDSIKGYLDVSGEYKSHEVSTNENPFHFKIPFTIEIPNNLDSESITLEINDFAYEMNDNKGISVHIELILNAKEQEEVSEEITEERTEEEKDIDLTELMDETVINEEPKEEEKEEEPTKERDIKTELESQLKNDTTDEFVTYHIHVIKEGETLESICSMYQVSEELIKEYNDISEFISGSKILLPVNNE